MKTSTKLPTARQMYDALCRRDAEFEGVFYVGVRTTGVFCRPTCPAKKPNFENVEFYHSTSDALLNGFRPCKRCNPIECQGNPPAWLRELLDDVERDPARRWTDQDVRNANCEPARVRRWFKQNHGMTFHAYLRARRLGSAIGQLKVGTANATDAAFKNGYESASGFRDAFTKWFGESPVNASRGQRPIIVNRLLTPLGPMIVAALDEKVCLLEFANRRMLETQFKRVQQRFARAVVPGETDLFRQVQTELNEYFDGLRQLFEFPLAMEGTDFQESVWNELREIPFGTTTSYESIAARIGRPQACRAVGRANGDNRLAIVIPCHRVVRSDGSLSGYGGGVWRKRWLLEYERANRV
jgi:AraC family transcriptional regulator of adaptative response/methylated-DNA-[protein]-cysteine methyltransferase